MTMQRTCGALVMLVLALLPRAVSAQTPAPTEAQLLERSVQNPNDISVLLDLAKLYVEQKRLDDASRTLTRAIAAVQREQLRSTAPPSQGLYRVGGDVREPKILKRVDPVYPLIAQTARVQGYVIVEAIVGTDGRVGATKVIKSAPLLDQAALDAVQQWEYEPPTLGGAPISVIMSLTVIFSLK